MAGLKAEFAALRPDEINMRLSICLTLGEWRKVHAAINQSGEHTHYGPLGVVTQAIASMVRQAERTWMPEGPEGSA